MVEAHGARVEQLLRFLGEGLPGPALVGQVGQGFLAARKEVEGF